MGETAAAAVLETVFDEQQARNLLFPEAVESPVLFSTTAAFCFQLRFVLLFPDNPLRRHVPSLFSFVETLSLDLALSIGIASTGHFTSFPRRPAPSEQEAMEVTNQVGRDLEGLAPVMLRWRRSLEPSAALRWERVTHGLFATMMEVSFFGTFNFIEMLACHLGEFDRQWQQYEIEHALGPGTSP